jgi:hypothetical protein
MFNRKDPIEKLVDRFVRSFRRLDDLSCFHEDPVPEELYKGIHPADWALVRWEPVRLKQVRSGLDLIRKIGKLPRAFECLVTHYAWLSVDLQVLRLFSNPPDSSPAVLCSEMFADPAMNDVLLPAGYVRFALAANGNYDAVCFDLNRMEEDDCPVVIIAHESVLILNRIDTPQTIYPSCQRMMESVIDLANKR